MKISIVTGPWLPVPAQKGGAMNRAWQGLAEEFAKAGHETYIIARALKGQPQKEKLNEVCYLRYGGFNQSKHILLNIIKDFFYNLQILPKLPQADILVINDFWLPIFSKLRNNVIGKKIVIVGRYPKGQFSLYASADSFITLSKAIKDALIKQYPECKDRTQVINLPVNPEVFKPSDQKTKTILYVGRLHPEKGVHLLIDAFAALAKNNTQFDLRIIGPHVEAEGGGGNSYLNKLKKQAQSSNVTFLSPIYDLESLAAEYRQASVFCYPSLAEKGETFGLSALEALASGTLPVVSSLKCFEDTIEDGKTGFTFNHLADNPTQALCDTLVRAIKSSDNPSFQENMCLKAEQFSYQHIAAQYLKEFNRLLEK